MLTITLPVYRLQPTGPQSRILRRLLAGGKLTGVRTGVHRVLTLLDGHEVNRPVVAGLLARDLIAERPTDDTTSEYHLTAAGRRWATGGR